MAGVFFGLLAGLSFGRPMVSLTFGGVGLVLVLVGVFARRWNHLTLGPSGLTFNGQLSIERISDIEQFDFLVADVDNRARAERLRVRTRTGPDVTLVLDALDSVMVRFIAGRLNTALAAVRESGGYRG
jgi:hypothetical protein